MMSTNIDTSKKSPPLVRWILLGMALGVATGLFFGDYCRWLSGLGRAYVGLLQMSVLPYMVVSLIANVGRLSAGRGPRVALVFVSLFVFLWLVGLLLLGGFSQSFPRWEVGSFFSTNFIEQPPSIDWLELFVPSNPFWSLAQNQIPAVVVFSIGLGMAVMVVPGKERLLDVLRIASQALSQLNHLVILISPIGIFAIAAEAMGTLDFEQLGLLQGYLLTYGSAALVLVLFILPALVSCCTPFSYREVLGAAKEPLVAAFMIGNSFVVLPLVIDRVERLFASRNMTPDQMGASPEFTVPIAYAFPDIGRIVGLVFIPFAAWFYGTRIDPSNLGPLLAVGVLGAFAKPVVTIPMLLEIAEIPSDIFNLYLSLGVVAARFGDLMKTMHLMAFAVLAGCLMHGAFRISWRRVLVVVAISLGMVIAAVELNRAWLEWSFKQNYSREKLITARTLLRPTVDSVSMNRSDLERLPFDDRGSALGAIRNRKVLRVGYDPDERPFSYRNDNGELVGFDIEMMHALAGELGLTIEFVPITDPGDLLVCLEEDLIDIAAGGIELTTPRALSTELGPSYLDVTLSLVVRDEDRSQFSSVEQIRQAALPRFAVVDDSYFDQFVRGLPTELEVAVLDSEREFFELDPNPYDALITSAEAGSAWTLSYPGFTVVNPYARPVRVPLYYAMPRGSDLGKFLGTWLDLKRKDGTLDQLYDYWILGVEADPPPRRWSILKDVLRWVD